MCISDDRLVFADEGKRLTMENTEPLGQIFLRYYDLPVDFEQEPIISAIKIVGVDETNEYGGVIRYQTIALRDDQRPKRVGDKVRTISVESLDKHWRLSSQEELLSDSEIYENSMAEAQEFLSSSLAISSSQASAIVAVIADITAKSNKRKINRAKELIARTQPS